MAPCPSAFDAMTSIRTQSWTLLARKMTIPPLAPDAEHSRPFFVALRELRDRIQTEFGVPLPRLSMGMSGDFAVAVEEGATLVRVGTAIFGTRKGKAWKPAGDAASFDD